MRVRHSFPLLAVAALMLVASPAFGDTALKSIAVKETCGMGVHLPSNSRFADQTDALMAFGDTDHKTLRIDDGHGMKTLKRNGDPVGYPQKPGDAISVTFEDGDLSVKLDLKLDGPCADNQYLDPENDACEYNSFSGKMTFKNKDGEKTYDVVVDDGC